MMIVEPGLLDHPKFLVLERAIGVDPLRILIRLWEHCQINKRGGNWGQVDDAYVEAVCRWEGEPGKLAAALRKGLGPNKAGWIERDQQDNLIVHDWDQNNATLVQRWNARYIGRQKKPHTNGSVDVSVDGSPEPSTEPQIDRQDRKEGEIDVTLPSLDEVLTWAQMGSGVDPEYARLWYSIKNERHEWVYRNRLVDWRAELKRKWEKNRGWFAKEREKKLSDGPATHESEELERVDAELQWQEDPKKIEALKKRQKELTQT